MTLSMLCLASYLIMHFAAGPQWVMPNEMCTPQFGMVLMGITLIVTKIGGIIGPIVAGYISDTAGSIMGGIWSIVSFQSLPVLPTLFLQENGAYNMTAGKERELWY